MWWFAKRPSRRGGKGEVSTAQTKERGVPVFKTCERCSGNGFSVRLYGRIQSDSQASSELHVRTWTRNWKPFLEAGRYLSLWKSVRLMPLS